MEHGIKARGGTQWGEWNWGRDQQRESIQTRHVLLSRFNPLRQNAPVALAQTTFTENKRCNLWDMELWGVSAAQQGTARTQYRASSSVMSLNMLAPFLSMVSFSHSQQEGEQYAAQTAHTASTPFAKYTWKWLAKCKFAAFYWKSNHFKTLSLLLFLILESKQYFINKINNGCSC